MISDKKIFHLLVINFLIFGTQCNLIECGLSVNKTLPQTILYSGKNYNDFGNMLECMDND